MRALTSDRMAGYVLKPKVANANYPDIHIMAPNKEQAVEQIHAYWEEVLEVEADSQLRGGVLAGIRHGFDVERTTPTRDLSKYVQVVASWTVLSSIGRKKHRWAFDVFMVEELESKIRSFKKRVRATGVNTPIEITIDFHWPIDRWGFIKTSRPEKDGGYMRIP